MNTEGSAVIPARLARAYTVYHVEHDGTVPSLQVQGVISKHYTSESLKMVVVLY